MGAEREVQVVFFAELAEAAAAQAGGKGRTLAALSRAGYPVPPGFVVLATAFVGEELKPGVWPQVQAALARLRGSEPARPLAVRSSALGEDSAGASFAGGFATVLDVRDDEAVRQALATVRASRRGARALAYAQAQGLGGEQEMAVVVQALVAADYAGVLFTADPVTGSRGTVVGNYIEGLGEQLVAGEASGTAFTLARPAGTYDGPPALRRFARPLYRLALQLERDLGGPQDIEWAIRGGRLALLQSRPITTLRADDPASGAWNSSRTGDCLWTRSSLGEAIPDVMTPSTWSLVQRLAEASAPISALGGCPAVGNIGGRYYLNLSVLVSLSQAFGVSQARFLDMNQGVFGRLPAATELPLIPFARFRLLRQMVGALWASVWRGRRLRQRYDAFVAEMPERCAALRAELAAATDAGRLLALWREQVEPLFATCCAMMGALAIPPYVSFALRRDLAALVGEADATALLSGLGDGARQIESLGPLLGLHQLASGELDRAAYARLYGHRGAHEFEISRPRPAEEPDWIDRQLAGLQQAPLAVPALLARQKEAHAAAWQRLQQRYPRKAKRLRRRIDQLAASTLRGETARSELIRMFWVLRAFVQRGGALLAQRDPRLLADAGFYLSIDELLAALGGAAAPLSRVAARRATHDRYAALPTYPTLIRGRFEPLTWAADPRRRSDFYDARGDHAPADGAITGFPGAAGVVEGRARVVATVEEGEALQPGEILVTTTTNIGWTLLFPRAAAVVTDVGAPLSHAAIVARELGIPAVVGCGNATMRLRTGDRVRVHGGQGTVEVVEPAAV